MYEKYYYLNERPFHITPDPKFLYFSRKHREALDLISFGIAEKKGFMLLTGEVGMGKTTLCRALLESLQDRTESALILNPLLSDFELLKSITADFGIRAGRDTVKGHIDRLNKFLLETASKGGSAVVIIDEAQGLRPNALEMVRLLSNLETEKEKLLQIVLVGQPELRDKLNMPELRQLNQRIIVRCDLEPLDFEETRAYIQNRIFVAGGRGAVEFSEEALGLICKESAGIPRLINIISDRTLTAAFVDDKRTVDGASARKALDELKKEGYLAPGKDKEVRQAGLYSNYAPHLAISACLIAFVILALRLYLK